jgi:hypothetical protein
VSLWLHDLQQREVVFTGDDPHLAREQLEEIALRLGASRVHKWVNKKTTQVLVRCTTSDRWKYGEYGEKEVRAAEMQAEGRDIVVIDVPGLLGLLEGVPAPTIVPNSPLAPARESASRGGLAGSPYRASRPVTVTGDGAVFRDPENVERGLRGHAATQDALADLVELVGLEPLRPFDLDCNFDLAWHELDGRVAVVEVKSLTQDNESFQVRHGLGQVLDYAHRLDVRGFDTRPLLALEREPVQREHWLGLCRRHGVTLTWAMNFPGALL